MITFNSLLRDEGVDPAQVKLFRHQDTRHADRITPFQLWHAADGRFELYQQIQRRVVFKGARMLASFVATNLNETLFVGLFDNKGLGKARSGVIDPITGKDVTGYNFYHLVLSSKLDHYRGRLIVNWGPGYRSWVPLARKKEKLIVEIQRAASDPPFPGLLDFSVTLSNLVTVLKTLRSALSAVSGIYLLTNSDTGKQYVGSAQGEGGFWGRWEQYVASGHGGNRRLQDVPAADYRVSVLEVASSSADANLLIEMENRWKKKLLSREFGLNAN